MLTPLLSLTIASGLLAAAPPPELGTIRQQVRRAKQELSVHPTLDDYRQSPFQPAQIVERVHALESDRAWAELCRELQLLPDDELERFEDEIRKPEQKTAQARAPSRTPSIPVVRQHPIEIASGA